MSGRLHAERNTDRKCPPDGAAKRVSECPPDIATVHTWLSAGACLVFVAVTEREIRVCTPRQTVLISDHVSSAYACIVHQLLPVPFRSVPFHS